MAAAARRWGRLIRREEAVRRFEDSGARFIALVGCLRSITTAYTELGSRAIAASRAGLEEADALFAQFDAMKPEVSVVSSAVDSLDRHLEHQHQELLKADEDE